MQNDGNLMKTKKRKQINKVTWFLHFETIFMIL